MDTESTKTFLRKFPVSGNGKVSKTDTEGFEFSVRKAVIKIAFQIQAVWHTSKLENPIATYRVKSGIQVVKKKQGKEGEERGKEKSRRSKRRKRR